MKLIEAYTKYRNGEITEEQAAEAFNQTVKRFRFTLTRYKDDIEIRLSVLDAISEDGITREEAATALKTSPREVNQLMKNWGITRPVKTYLVDKEKADIKWAIRKRFAIDFIAGSVEISDAADNADCSERQMRRWVSDLINEHYGMKWGDLKLISNRRRAEMAQEIEEKEGLKLEKQQALNDIIRGKKSLEEAALERIGRK